MNRFDSKAEWKALNEEIFKFRPKTAPYPKEIVKARENLLKAQVLLAAYDCETSSTERKLLAQRYLQTMGDYFEILAKTSLV